MFLCCQNFPIYRPGNHAIFTLGSGEKRIALNVNPRTPCVENHLNELFETKTPFVLAHMQYSSFNDWLAHVMRGASDYGYNNLPDDRVQSGRSGVHYCRVFHRMLSALFQTLHWRKQYASLVCSTKNAELAYSRAFKLVDY